MTVFLCKYFSWGLQENTIVYDMISMLMSSYITVIKKIFATSNMNKIVICKEQDQQVEIQYDENEV